MYMASQRREYILRLLEQRGSLRTAALARELRVTDESIRTDLVQMSKQGLLERVHGGARFILPSQTGSNTAESLLISEMVTIMLSELHQLAERENRELRLYLDDAPVTRALIAKLAELPGKIMTASLALQHYLSPAAIKQGLICPSGVLNKRAGLIEGQGAWAQLREMQPDVAILVPLSFAPQQLGYASALASRWAEEVVESSAASWVVGAAYRQDSHAKHLTHPLRYSVLISEDNLSDDPEWDELDLRLLPYLQAPEHDTEDY